MSGHDDPGININRKIPVVTLSLLVTATSFQNVENRSSYNLLCTCWNLWSVFLDWTFLSHLVWCWNNFFHLGKFSLWPASGFLGLGNKCVPVPRNLCAIAYDDDGCKVCQIVKANSTNLANFSFQTSQESRILSRPGHALSVMIEVSQFVRNSRLCY